MISNDLAEELEFLRYFYDQCSLSIPERIFLEEGYSMCFNRAVPESMKIRRSILPLKEVTPKIPPPPNLPHFNKILELINTDNYEVIDKESGESVSLSMLIQKLKIMTGVE